MKAEEEGFEFERPLALSIDEGNKIDASRN